MNYYRCMNCGEVVNSGRSALITCPHCEKQYLCELDFRDLYLRGMEDSNQAYQGLLLEEVKIEEAEVLL